MPGLVINGAQVQIPGLNIVNYLDDPRLEIKAPEDGTRRKSWVRSVVLHTTKGIPGGKDKRPQVIHPGLGPNTNVGLRSATYCRTNPDSRGGGTRSCNGGHHLTVDHDGTITCHADLAKWSMYHANTANQASIGIEMFQASDAGLYAGQLEIVVLLVDALTRLFGIQRQIPDRYRGPLARLGRGQNGMDLVGVIGHRDVSNTRGPGDPGDEIFTRLEAAGYKRVDFSSGADLALWKVAQAAHGLTADGVPGPMTYKKLGQLVRRPGD